MEVIVSPGDSGSGSGSGDLPLSFTTDIAGALPAVLPAGSLVQSIVVKCTAIKAAVSLGLVAGDAALFIDNVDFTAGEIKTFAPGVFVPAGATLFGTNTNTAGLFTFTIFYKLLTGY